MRAWAAGLVVLIAGGAVASRVHYESVDLPELVRSADVIVVAHPGEPSRKSTNISVGAKAPPFVRIQVQFVVDEVVRGDAALKGKSIWIDGANYVQRLHLHRSYYVDGVSKSPIYQRYEGSGDDGAAESMRVLFLSGSGKELEFAVDGGSESLKKLPEIRDLLKKK